MKRICIAIPRSHDIGGVELYALELALSLSNEYAVTLLVAESVPSHLRLFFEHKASALLRICDFRSLLDVYRLVKAHGSHAVIVHEGNYMDTPTAFLWGSRFASRKSILCLHAMPQVFPPHDADRRGFGLWWKRIRIKGWLHARRFDAVNVVSNAVGDRLAKSFCLNRERIGRFPSSVDGTRFKACDAEIRRKLRRKWSLPDDARIVGFIGRFSSEKGVLAALEAEQRIVSQGSHPSVHFLFAGQGPLLDELNDRIRSTPALARVSTVLGFQDCVQELFQCVDVIIMPSETEGCPRVLLEAMAVGIPVVASAIPAFAEVIGRLPELSSGIQLVPVSSPEGYAEFILAIFEWNSAYREMVGEILRKGAEELASAGSCRTWWVEYIESLA